MDTHEPNREEWMALLDTAAQVKVLQPWDWMEETDIFGVQDPETGLVGFVSVMGSFGEHFGISLYLGQDGLGGFLAMQAARPEPIPEMLMETPQLHISWEDRNDLSERDRKRYKELDLKFRGRQTWPMLRSYRPGYLPWYLEAGEARFFNHALQQLLDFAVRYQNNPSLLEMDIPGQFLVRVPRQDAENLVWSDQRPTYPPPPPKNVQLTMNLEALQKVQALPMGEEKLEIDFFWMPFPVSGPGVRPYYPYNLLLVDSHIGMILGSEMLHVDPDLESMWREIPRLVVEILAKVKMRPKEVLVQTPLMHALMATLNETLGFELVKVERLKKLDVAKSGILSNF